MAVESTPEDSELADGEARVAEVGGEVVLAVVELSVDEGVGLEGMELEPVLEVACISMRVCELEEVTAIEAVDEVSLSGLNSRRTQNWPV